MARAIASLHREAAREKELRDAEHRARMAELDLLAARLVSLQDGVDGAPGRDGKDGAPGADGRDGAPGPAGEPGVAGMPGPVGVPGDRGADGKDGAPGLPGEKGEPGKDGADGQDGAPGERGEKGDRGADGAPGQLPIVRQWIDGVHYAGDVVAHRGATWQAIRDTGREPPHEDWTLIAAAGLDGVNGRTPSIRGTWSEMGEYRALDVVMLGGASFVAKRDAPGICPGEGWQLFAAQGKRGNPGERGAPGAKGDRGEPGPAVKGLGVDREGLLTLVNADGSVVTCDLYPLLSKAG